MAVAAALLAAAAAAAAAAASAPAASARVSFSRPLTMDAYSPLHSFHSIPVSTPRALARRLYVAVVRGTASFYQPVDYLDIQKPFTVMCGRALPAPLFPSVGGVGPVGLDAAFVFAQPLVGKPCSAIKLPRAYPNFQVNLGGRWAHPNLVTAEPLRGPNSSHTYTFALDAHGKPASFRMIDPDTRDDYGSFRIYVRPAVRADCAGEGHTAFFLSLNACLQDTPAVPAPRLPPPSAPLTLDQSPVIRVLRSSDLPTGINGEVPSGALTARQFAQVDNASANGVSAERSLLGRAGFLSGAISEFTGPGMPAYKSTAAEFASAAQAQQALAGELALAPTTQAPAGTTAAPAVPDPKIPGAYLITYAPGSLELLAAKGQYVLALVAVANPAPVSRASTEQLFVTLLARS